MGEKDYLEIFDESLQRVTTSGDAFFDRFYASFLDSSDEIKNKFAKTNFQVQKLLLRQSLSYLLEFSAGFNDIKHLKNLANTHSKSQKDIDPALYEHWLTTLIKTVKEFDPNYNTEVELAWRVILAPGIEYMKHHHDSSK